MGAATLGGREALQPQTRDTWGLSSGLSPVTPRPSLAASGLAG